MDLDWAVYGERNGGHALLSASGNSSFASGLTQYTDRPGTPPLGIDWGPVTSGFYFKDFFICLRTLPDINAGRAGMVRSYAAFIPKIELGKVGTLQGVFNLLPNALLPLQGPLAAIHLDQSNKDQIGRESDDQSLRHVAKQLCSAGSTLPLVWSFSEDYLPLVDSLWKRLPDSLKAAFAFSFQFAPEHQLPSSPTLIATLPSLAGRWPGNQILKVSGTLEPPNSAENWIMGQKGQEDFTSILDSFGVTISRFSDLELCSSLVDCSRKLDQADFSQIRKILRIIEKHSSFSSKSQGARKRMIDRLCELVRQSSPDQIATLRNLNEELLPDLIRPLSKSIQTWLNAALSIDTPETQLISTLEIAVKNEALWWSKPFVAWLKTVAKFASDDSALIFKRFIFASNNLTSFICSVVEDDVESKLVESVPKVLSRQQSDDLLALADRNGWMKLHASLLLQLYPPADAVNMHCELQSGVGTGLEFFLQTLGYTSLLSIAEASSNPPLIKFLGDNLEQNIGKLPDEFVETNALSLRLIMGSVKTSPTPLNDALHKLVVKALLFNEGTSQEAQLLLLASSAKSPALLLEIDHLSDWISSLSLSDQNTIKVRIIDRCWTEWCAGRIVNASDPDALEILFPSDEIVRRLKIASPNTVVSIALVTFRSMPYLSDSNFCEWLISLFTATQYSPINANDADLLSTFMQDVDFPQSARVISETAIDYNRWDVQPIHNAIRYKYQMTLQKVTRKNSENVKLPRVVIATALSLEREEVMKLLPNGTYNSDLCVDVAIWPLSAPIFEIFVLQTGAGNLDAQGKTLEVLGSLKPKLAFFVGVCGGVKDSDVGDVVYSTKVYYIEAGKEEDTFKTRPETEKTNDKLVQLAHRIAAKSWRPLAEEVGQPKATAAVFASGEKVLASTDQNAATYQRIKSSYNDVQVIDMETYGFLKAAHHKNVKFSIGIRGVSDKLKGKTDSDAKGNQPMAAANAVKFLFELLSACPALLNKKQRRKILGIF